MAQNPIGTVADEERLVPLLTRDGGFYVDVTAPVRDADVAEDGPVVWRSREAGDVNRLAFAPVDDPEAAGDLYTGELSSRDGAVRLTVPEPLLVDGLDLDTEAYDDDNALLFEPRALTDGMAVGMTREGEPGGAVEQAIELVPVRYADGTPFRAEPVPELSVDSDPIAEGELARAGGDEGTPQSGAISAPISPTVIEEVLDTTDAPRTDVIQALETIARHRLVGEADDAPPGEPVAVDDRVVVGLDDETWAATAARLDVGDAAIEATKAIHARQADDILRRSEVDPQRLEGTIPVVLGRDRAYATGTDPER